MLWSTGIVDYSPYIAAAWNDGITNNKKA